MRSLLFVPGDSERKQEKALRAGADALVLDLEDSVAPGRKPVAREAVRAFIAESSGPGAPLLFVRVNELAGGMVDDDLAAVMPSRPDGIVLPKSGGADDVLRLCAKLRVHEAENGFRDGATLVLPIVESAAAVLAGGHSRPLPRLCGLCWGAEDLASEIGAGTVREEGRYRDVFSLSRSATLLAASAAGVAAVDTVYPDFRDERGFSRECAEAERDGFGAKLAIHPDQVPIVNSAFTPSDEALEEARAVVAAFAEAGDAGAVGIGGKMYDRPHLKRAERLIGTTRATRG